MVEWCYCTVCRGVCYCQVLPVVIENLPLKEDMEENATVYKCIVQLFGKKHPAVSYQTAQLVAAHS